MEQNNKPSIKISGSGSAGGGDFDQIKISGSGKISGNTTCNFFKISGSASVDGNIEMEEGHISGSAKFHNSVKANYLKISGSAKSLGSMDIKELKVSGSLNAEQALTGEQMNISGVLKLEGDCNAETFEMNGQCKIGGLLNADRIDISLEGKSDIKAIGAETIKVTAGSYGSNFIKEMIGIFSDQSQKLFCESIEGDDIYLENTICDEVRGGRIVIGKGCQIKLVEYTGTLEVNGDAKIETQRQI